MFIGLTGGMGCGKSATLSFFLECGYMTLDADKICHELYSNKGSVLFEQLHKRWGDAVISVNGTIDRASVGKIVFTENDELEWLNGVLHPAVFSEGFRIYNNSGKKDTIFDVPLLFEAGWESYFDKTVSVWCREEIRMKRLLKRGMSKCDIERRDKMQFKPELKMERADYVIINNNTLEHLKQQCKVIGDKLTT